MSGCSRGPLAAACIVFLFATNTLRAQDADLRIAQVVADRQTAAGQVIAAGVRQIEAAERALITVDVADGTPPFTIDASIAPGSGQGLLEGSGASSMGRSFELTYTPADSETGVVPIDIRLSDAAADEAFRTFFLTICFDESLPVCALQVTDESLQNQACDEDISLFFGASPKSCSDFINDPSLTVNARRLAEPNLAVAAVLGLLDIDGDGLADGAKDTDGDGLPDNWERGGFEALTAGGDLNDRIVFFSAPTAIVPGTPPTPIFNRLGVATDALNPDTDGDGISDFIEVFGLMFIDENRNGLLDSFEWEDQNLDGLPSPAEYPLDNTGTDFSPASPLLSLRHDFDGFLFTDPTNPDTDGDGLKDGEDNDPLINPRAFGNLGQIIVRFNAEGNADIDQDGIGNGMDMGNDLTSQDSGTGQTILDFQVIDNPENVRELIELFRKDLEQEGIVPESAIEDLLGADWDGNGLWRTTDVRTWSIVIADPADPSSTPPAQFFEVGALRLYATQTFDALRELFNGTGYDVYADAARQARNGGMGIGLGWQDLLRPSGATPFIPDDRVWAILYSWRMPGFDIDGDGFIGVPNLSATTAVRRAEAPGIEIATAALRFDAARGRFLLSDQVPIGSGSDSDRPFDDRIDIGDVADSGTGEDTGEPTLDGRVDPPPGFPTFGCGAIGLITGLGLVLGLAAPRFLRRL